MSTVQFARAADRLPEDGRPAGSGSLDLSTIEGDWFSASRAVGGVARMSARQQDGVLMVGASGDPGHPRPGDWDEITAEGVYSNALTSSQAYAFIATFEDNQVRSELQGYSSVGVVTAHSFFSFPPGSSRRDYYTREFFVPGPGYARWLPGEPVFPAALLSGGEDDPAELLGSWECLEPSVRSLGRLDCQLSGGKLVLRAHAVGTDGLVDWGPAPARTFADASFPGSPPALRADYDHGFMRMHLQARVNRGILVAVEYADFADGSGRSDYYLKECFQRVG